MKVWMIEVDPTTGHVLLTYRVDEEMHICFRMDGDENDVFAEMVSKANLDSKLARS